MAKFVGYMVEFVGHMVEFVRIYGGYAVFKRAHLRLPNRVDQVLDRVRPSRPAVRIYG